MSFYWFNRQEILQKIKERYSKEKVAEYYLQNKETIKGKSRNYYKNLSQEEKNKFKEYQKEKYSKEKAAQYYLKNKEAIKENARKCYKNLPQEEKDKIKEYKKKEIKN